MRSELFQVVQQRAAIHDPRVRFNGLQSRQPEHERVTDAEGSKLVPRKSLSLIEKLMLRSQGKALPVAAKRGRGRPRKGVSV